MVKIFIVGLQSSTYAFIVLYIYAYTRKSSYHRNKIIWFLNLLELTISLNYQFASYMYAPSIELWSSIVCLWNIVPLLSAISKSWDVDNDLVQYKRVVMNILQF
jgi:hypothetical protein